MDLTRDIRLMLGTFVVMCLAALSNLLFFQGKRLTAVSRAPGMENARVAIDDTATRPSARLSDTTPAASRERATETGALTPMEPAEIVRGIQKNLMARGYEPGQSDGVPGLITRAAVMAYEFDSGLALTGEPSRELMQHMLAGPASQPAIRKGAPEVRGQQAADIVKWVARQLSGAGYPAGAEQGAIGPELVRAIRDYETAQKIPVTGRISAPLVARLARPPSPAKVSAR